MSCNGITRPYWVKYNQGQPSKCYKQCLPVLQITLLGPTNDTLWGHNMVLPICGIVNEITISNSCLRPAILGFNYPPGGVVMLITPFTENMQTQATQATGYEMGVTFLLTGGMVSLFLNVSNPASQYESFMLTPYLHILQKRWCRCSDAI